MRMTTQVLLLLKVLQVLLYVVIPVVNISGSAAKNSFSSAIECCSSSAIEKSPTSAIESSFRTADVLLLLLKVPLL